SHNTAAFTTPYNFCQKKCCHSKKNIYSGGYKKELLSGRYSKFIGVNSDKEISRYNGYFTSIYKSNKCFILDCDAHSHEEIPSESMWVKVANNSTNSFFEALEEYQITVSLENPQIPNIFIEGLHIDYTKDGYLTGKNKTNYCVQYSPSLNSYIGGRGSGKSTALDLINFVLTQEFKDDSHLYFFSQHGEVSVLVHYYNEEYIVTMELPHFGSSVELIADLSDLDPSIYREKIYYNKNKIKQKILRKFVSVYKITKIKSNEFIAEKQAHRKATIEKFYDDRYSINSLVEKANNNEFGGFIQDLFFSDGYLDALGKKIKFNSNNGLLKFLGNIGKILEERKSKVESRINPYNLSQKDKMRIVYIQKNVNVYELPHSLEIPKSRISREYDITQKEATEYIHYLIRTLSFNEFIKLCINKTMSLEFNPISSFARIQRAPNLDKENLTPSNSYDAMVVLLDDFLRANNISKLLAYYKNKLNAVEEFTIEFDVNAYESSRQLKSIFKDIKELSLGQKVVTILNLILSHGDFSNNHKPVIIDQPEDNLDSRYIYKNLVEQLRQLKEKRQIIIATHNSTLVTNSLSENVIIMESDGEHGWISKYGYALSPPIKKEILNILEGGPGSFKHRQSVFNDVIS
ncbi:TPA: Spaf_1101 family AAA-like ATPase, partial [Enterococcus faecium]